MEARGPDDVGLVARGRVAFGHRRLKIIDLSDAAAQPFTDAQLGLTIAFNGCIYNYEALRAKSRDDYPAVANQCSLRMGRVYLANDRVEDALPLFNEIIDSRLSTDPSIVAGAFNGRGRCLFWQGQNELAQARQATNDKEPELAEDYRADALASFRAARLDFLRVQTMYLSVAREQPESLYWGGQAFLNVASLDTAEVDAERFGKILMKRCADRYPQSEWGSQAKDQI